MVYLSSLGESVLVLDIGLGVSSEGISRMLGFFIFNSNSNLMESPEVRVIGKDHLFTKVR